MAPCPSLPQLASFPPCPPRMARACLSLMTAMVTQGPEAARDVCGRFDLNNKTLHSLVTRRGVKVSPLRRGPRHFLPAGGRRFLSPRSRSPRAGDRGPCGAPCAVGAPVALGEGGPHSLLTWPGPDGRGTSEARRSGARRQGPPGLLVNDRLSLPASRRGAWGRGLRHL